MENKHHEHQELVKLVLARESQQASELMREHLLTPIPIIMQVMVQNNLLDDSKA